MAGRGGPKTSNISGEFRIAWTVHYDQEVLKQQKQSTVTRRSLYQAPTEYDLNGVEGDGTLMRKTSTTTGRGPFVFTTTNGLGSTERALFPNDLEMAKEALKMKYTPGPILADGLSVSNPRLNPTGTKGIFFGTVAVVANDRVLPGDYVMLDMTNPNEHAKAYGAGRVGTSRNTRRPLIYVKYTPMKPTATLLRHIRKVINTPDLYRLLSSENPKTAKMWENAVSSIFRDEMLTVSLGIHNLLDVLQPRPEASELRDDLGDELSKEETTTRIAQMLGAIPIDNETAQVRDRSANGVAFWKMARKRILNMKYYDGKNINDEFGFHRNGREFTSDARDLKSRKLKNNAAGNIVRQQLNSSTRRIVSTYMAADDAKRWVMGVMLVGARAGDKGVLLMTQTKL